MTTERVPAVGGQRTVPAPDAVARGYILLALRLEGHIPGLVDGYFGPAALKAQVDMEQLRAPARLRDDAAALRARLAADVAEPDRRAWLDVQLVALETQAAALAGDALPYLDHVTRCFDHTPAWIPDDRFDEAAARIDELLPGDGPLEDRLAAWDKTLEIPVDRLPAVLDWLIGSVPWRGRRAVRAPRWRGPARSRSSANNPGAPTTGSTAAGARGSTSIRTCPSGRPPSPAPSPTRPTRATISSTPPRRPSWSTARVASSPRSCSSTRPSASSARASRTSVSDSWPRPASAWTSSSSSSNARACQSTDPAATRATAERAAAVETHRSTLDTIGGNVALLRHVEGRSHEEAVAYLRDIGRLSPARAEKRLEFIEHPLWRTYVFVYAEGEALLERWLEAVPDGGARRQVRAPPARTAHPGGGQISRLNTTRSSPSAS